jgi:hypothetical protein
MHSDSLKKLTAHRDDRRFRELYRYFQPSNPAALLYPQYIPSSEQDPSTYTVEGASHALASVPTTLNRPISPNATLTSFAQLACVQLKVQRAIIRYVLGVVRMQDAQIDAHAVSWTATPSTIWRNPPSPQTLRMSASTRSEMRSGSERAATIALALVSTR